MMGEKLKALAEEIAGRNRFDRVAEESRERANRQLDLANQRAMEWEYRGVRMKPVKAGDLTISPALAAQIRSKRPGRKGKAA
jgi:hypothetical protein